MKLAIAILISLLIIPSVAPAQDGNEVQDNPLAADLPLVVSRLATGTIQTESTGRLGETIASSRSRYSLSFNRRFGARRPAPTRTDLRARQAQFFYFPHYPGRATIGVSNQRKPALAPRPITYTPYSDPFYEENVLKEVLKDGSGYYP